MSDLVVGDISVFSNDLAVTQWVLDKVITVPAENLPTWAAVVYFASPIGIGAAGIGALAGFAVDEVNHYAVQPAIATLEKLAEVTGVADGVDSLVNETASTINDNMDVLGAVARAGAGEDIDVEALIRGRAQAEQPSSAESGQAELHEPAPGGGVLLRPEDAPATADPEPSVAHEPGWGVLLPPEERAQRETQGSAQGAVPASTNGVEQPAPQAEPAGEATPPAEGPEQPYPMAGEATPPVEGGDYPSPEPDNAPIPEARPPEPEPGLTEDALAEEAEGD